MHLVHLFIASGPLLGAAGWFLPLSWLFWVGVAICTITLFLVESSVPNSPVLPVLFMWVAAALFSPWYVGIGIGLLIWTALWFAGEIYGLRKEGRL